ncbi:hypothetical protein EJ06DRAFT_394302 [Trichodelitschia bisporula]|uniref:Uncharacterized protein n=1 Tax=Trichodelitschia bisporula TaxID=703511 RepID=A0A6G1I0A0_9PEZI|nr:hypothetical protein EJ06DRAFT_394302 [Trichodelitschia bisporula]
MLCDLEVQLSQQTAIQSLSERHRSSDSSENHLLRQPIFQGHKTQSRRQRNIEHCRHYHRPSNCTPESPQDGLKQSMFTPVTPLYHGVRSVKKTPKLGCHKCFPCCLSAEPFDWIAELCISRPSITSANLQGHFYPRRSFRW